MVGQRVEIDCTTGQAAAIPLTEDEQADHDARRAAAAATEAAQQEAAAQQAADLAALKAKAAEDPAFAALLRTLGLDPTT
jgi:hypothetical protein